VTTAFVVVGSLSFSTAQSRPSAHPSLAQIAGHDNNHEFPCSYGSFKVSHYGSSSDSSYSSTWTHVAMPIMGHGKKVDRITIANEGTVGVRRLQVKLRTSNASDLPGDPVAGRSRAGTPGKLISGFPGDPIAEGNGIARLPLFRSLAQHSSATRGIGSKSPLTNVSTDVDTR
jgi:hypothetical protein